MIDVQNVRHWLAGVPMPVWAIAATEAVLLGVVVGVVLHARRKAKAPDSDSTSDGQDSAPDTTALLVIALALCSVVLGAFIVGTYEGSTAFAIDKLGWNNWRKVIPWAALDAGGFGFGLLWIRAVILKRNPVRPRRVVYLCSGFSATLQMIQGGTKHAWQAGLFLAFLAVIVGLVLHTLVDQLRDSGLIEEDWHKHPPFGLRWITYFPNTFAAFLAWVNHPAPEGTDPTVANALANLAQVRADKLAASAARLADRGRFDRWTMIAPWVRPRQITAVITSVETKAAATVEQVRADLTEQITKVLGEQAAATERADSLAAELNRLRESLPQQITAADHAAREQVSADYEQALSDLREQVEREQRARAETERRLAARTEQTRQRQSGGDQRKSAPQVSQLRSDDEIAKGLFKAYREQMERGDGPLSRYRVEVDGECATRQANRVLELLANRYAEHARQSGGQTPVQGDRTDDEEHHPASPELVGELIAAGGTG